MEKEGEEEIELFGPLDSCLNWKGRGEKTIF